MDWRKQSQRCCSPCTFGPVFLFVHRVSISNRPPLPPSHYPILIAPAESAICTIVYHEERTVCTVMKEHDVEQACGTIH